MSNETLVDVEILRTSNADARDNAIERARQAGIHAAETKQPRQRLTVDEGSAS